MTPDARDASAPEADEAVGPPDAEAAEARAALAELLASVLEAATAEELERLLAD